MNQSSDRLPSRDDSIIVECPECGEVLFRGTRQEAKGLIIYCVDCS